MVFLRIKLVNVLEMVYIRLLCDLQSLVDDDQAKRLKAIMMAAAEFAALRLQDIPSTNHEGIEMEQSQSDRVFRLLDKNGDGRINIEELMEVMEELGAPGEDAREMMQLLDANSDGSLSSDEFDFFQRQVKIAVFHIQSSYPRKLVLKGLSD